MEIAKRANRDAAKMARRLRAEREKQQLSQEAVAKRAGIDAPTLSRIENARFGTRGPGVSKLLRIARALGLSATDLLT